jgi:hypothetical protein
MRRFLKEPLFHFLLFGALIFAVYGWINRDVRAPDEIFISKGQQEHLVNMFSRTWQRPPTPEEYQGLLRDFIREEIAYRESVAMGLDEGDVIIRRRMRQKLELLTDEIVSFAEPQENELQSFLVENPDRFRSEAVMDLRQVYISVDKHGDNAINEATSVLNRLLADPEVDWMSQGDVVQLPALLKDIRTGELGRLFGKQFTDGLAGLDVGVWSGPIRSGYGLHLVAIDRLEAARDPSLVEVRDEVKTEWLEQRRRQATDELYDRMAQKYLIEIESLAGDATG